MSRTQEFHSGRTGDGTTQLDIEPVTAAVVAQYHNAHGGSSFYVHGGGRADHGWSVGGLQGAPETSVDSPRITPEDWQRHRDRVRAQVTDKNAIAGTWVEDGKSVMDASNAVQSREDAKALQAARNQRAVYNLHENREEDLR